MKIFNFSSLVMVLTLLTGCQTFQFVESPIPVSSTSLSAQTVATVS